MTTKKLPSGVGWASGGGSLEGVSSSKMRFEYIYRNEIFELVGVERVRKLVGRVFREIGIFSKKLTKFENLKKCKFWILERFFN